MIKSDLQLNQEWDVIVIGTGMGGATVGYALAEAGFSVLFLEKGGEVTHNDGWIEETNPENRLAQGWWPQPMSQSRQSGKFDQFYAALGCGFGGSSIHYGAALERFERTDFDPLMTYDKTLVQWPVSFNEFLPYYEKAETLYRITYKNENDAPSLNLWDQSFLHLMQKNGLKPDRLNIAINYDKNCEECIGKVCPRKCKADAKSACLDTALQHPKCHILDYCDVQTLEADQHKINHIVAVHKGETLKLRAKIVVLAAGAMHSPQLLLKSKNTFWPNGLANNSDQVGRNLMFHISDMYAVWSPTKLSRQGLQKKSISIRDFYNVEGRRLGYIQSLGLDAGNGHIAMFLKDTLRKFGIRNSLLLSIITKIPAYVTATVLGKASLFAVSIEDDPSVENRITLNENQPNGTSFSYKIPLDIQARADTLYKVFSKRIKPWRMLRIMPKIDINHGHSCGTCKFGDDPKNSVLNRDCKAHDIDNLYVVDASFMPRSGAANPSLTIAANALRVAEKITESLLKQ
jgi:choline dehydrogenase-like flavoprotein